MQFYSSKEENKVNISIEYQDDYLHQNYVIKADTLSTYYHSKFKKDMSFLVIEVSDTCLQLKCIKERNRRHKEFKKGEIYKFYRKDHFLKSKFDFVSLLVTSSNSHMDGSSYYWSLAVDTSKIMTSSYHGYFKVYKKRLLQKDLWGLDVLKDSIVFSDSTSLTDKEYDELLAELSSFDRIKINGMKGSHSPRTRMNLKLESNVYEFNYGIEWVSQRIWSRANELRDKKKLDGD